MVDFGYITTERGVSIRHGAWPARGERKGTVVLLGGRFEFMEKYAEVASDLNRRGFFVHCLDWRGQGLSTRLLRDRHRGYVGTYEEYIHDLQQFLDRIVVPRAVPPLVFLTHSMGGHIALRYLLERPDGCDRLVLVSPMLDICTAPFPRALARLLARLAPKAGFGRAYVFGAAPYTFTEDRFGGNRLTSDPLRFLRVKREILKKPALALGGVTYHWLRATFASIDALNDSEAASRLTLPVLLVSAGKDRVVSLEAQTRLCEALRRCVHVTIGGARHEILMERDPLRDHFWEAFDLFLDQPNGITRDKA